MLIPKVGITEDRLNMFLDIGFDKKIAKKKNSDEDEYGVFHVRYIDVMLLLKSIQHNSKGMWS